MRKNTEYEIGKEEFLELPPEEIRCIVKEKGIPKVGIFIADGNRRLVMCRTRLSPTSDEFYREYARFFVDSLKESLNIFFDHGLETLFFPLFGPSLLLRKNKFQSLTIPDAYREIFQSDEWVQFYREKGIRVKAYGDLSQLEKIDINHLNMAEGIRQTVEKTAGHDMHTVFFGFMSENTPGLEMPQHIIDFFKIHDRPPSPGEMVEIYYGENLPGADFYIFSDKLSIRALPPFLSTADTHAYYLPVPGFLGLNKQNYKNILYDLLFPQNQVSVAEYTEEDIKSIKALEEFFRSRSNTVVGIQEKQGVFSIPQIY